MDVFDGLQVRILGESLISRYLDIVTVAARAHHSAFSWLTWHSIAIRVTFIDRIISAAKRPTHLLRSHILISKLGILHQQLFDHLGLQLDVETHAALGTFVAVDLKARLGGFVS